MTAKGDTVVSSKVSTPFGGVFDGLSETKQEEEENEDENDTNSRPASRVSEKAPSPEAKEALITMKVPTHTNKSRKRKHILTNFDDSKLLDSATLDAQRKEKERLERLEKIEQSISNTDHIQQVAALQPLPVIDLTDNDFVFDDFRPPVLEKMGTIFDQPEVIDVSSDDDDIQEVGSVTHSKYFPPRRNRWNIPEREKLSFDEMEKQQRLEEERLKRKEHLLRDSDRVETTSTGRLVVNKGHPSEDPDITVAPHLTRILQPHQLGGICFMYNNVIESLEEYKRSPGFGCILAHSMGLGKTLQIVTFTEIFFRATNAHKVLIIVPINTIQNWWNEFEKWMPKFDDSGNKIRNFNVFILGDTVKTFDQRVNLLEEWTKEGGVLIIGYDMFRMLLRSTQPKKKTKTRMKLNFINGQRVREEVPEKPDTFDQGFTNGGRVKKEANDLIRQALLNPGPELVVCDEGHKIKNLNTDISIALGAIRTTRRIVLTGYPLQNNLMEYYCMVDFVRPKYLGEKKTFSIMFEKPIKNGQCVDSTQADWKLAAQRTHVLVEKLRGFVQRRTHHLLKTILPTSREYVVLLRKSDIQQVLYKNFLIYAQGEIRNGTNVFNPLKAFAACSKIWNHPDVLHKTLEIRKEKRRKELESAQSSSSNNSLVPSPFGSSAAHVLGMPMNNNWPMMSGGDLDIGDFDDESNKPKKGKKPQTLFSALLEEEGLDADLENGLKYDWAEWAMGNYRPGNLENGYKMKIAMEIIEETIAIGEKILFFSQNLTALDVMEQYLHRVFKENGEKKWIKNQTYFRLDGSTNGTEREKLIKRFNGEKAVSLFLISTRAGSLGINLVSANRCIILDACWNPCHDAQAVCRVYRYGQQKETFIYRLIMDNSMERAIFNRQVSKHGLQQRVVDDAKVDANVTQRELETLLMYDEALDVSDTDSGTSHWEIQDPVLKKIAEKHRTMLSTEPFLHESLIIEREEGLSEQEKLEAKVMYERERMDETNSLFGRSGLDTRNSIPPSMSQNQQPIWHQQQFNNQAPPPLSATPMPYQLSYNNNNTFQNQMNNAVYRNPMNNMIGSNMMVGPNVSLPMQPLPYPAVSFPNASSFSGTSMNNGIMSMNINDNFPNPDFEPSINCKDNFIEARSYNEPLRPAYAIYTFLDGTPSVPNFTFPGAAYASQCVANDIGTMQMIVMDQSMQLPSCTNQNRLTKVFAGEEVMLIRNPTGIFLKLRNGNVLNAGGTVYDTAPRFPSNMAPFGRPPSSIAPLPNLGPADLIELD